MNSKKKNNYSKNEYKVHIYSYLTEGKADEIVLFKLKTDIIQNKKISLCSTCKNCFPNIYNGTISIDKLKEFANYHNQCKKIVIMDQDEISNEKIQEYKKLSNNNSLIIISKPNLEIILLSIFQRIESELHKADVEKKLKLHFEKSVSKQEYKHTLETTEKIMDYLFNNKSKIFSNWKNNLIKLNELGLSNFIELINFLEKTKESNNK